MKLRRHGGVVSGALAAAALMWQVTQAGAWSLEEAAKPYNGQTIRLVGKSLPPLEAIKKMAPQFEKLTGITVEVEMYEHSEAVNKVHARPELAPWPLRRHHPAAPGAGKFATNGHLEGDRSDDGRSGAARSDLRAGKAVLPAAWHEISWYDGKEYGFPFTVLNMFMWYRSGPARADPKERKRSRQSTATS